MLDNSHESFSPPKDNCAIWRYTDFTKLLSLLESKQIYFPRADQFSDPYEGVFSKPSAIATETQLRSSIGESAKDVLKCMVDFGRTHTYISCWYVGEHESAAMWKLYLQSPEGIAIRSDHDSLCAALAKSRFTARTSLVRYVDYETTLMPPNNLFYPFVHKRLSFAHEQELRAIIWSAEGANQPFVLEDALGILVDVEPEHLIKAVHVCPNAPVWFGQLVQQVVTRYGLACPIVRSTMYERPTY